jgi:1-acyl-sn-glycerol-3-phosphate acyltransferase
VVAVGRPIMWWSRMRVTGLDCLPAAGPVLLVADHDSYWDPIAIAVAAAPVRNIRALAKSTLWKNPIAARILDGMGQIPIERGKNNAGAMGDAISALRGGAGVGVVPEGTRSLGRDLRARSGVGRLAQEVPEATVVCARVNGTVDVVRFPRRPRIRVEFYRPSGGGRRPDETAVGFAKRLLAELRKEAPPEIPGRRRAAAKFREAAGR